MVRLPPPPPPGPGPPPIRLREMADGEEEEEVVAEEVSFRPAHINGSSLVISNL